MIGHEDYMEQLLYESLKKHLQSSIAQGKHEDPKRLLALIEEMEFRDPALRDYRVMKFQSRNSRFVQLLDTRRAMFDSVISTANMALKSALLINGGACVAVMGLIAGVMKENNQSVYSFELNYALASFGFGVFAGGVASAATYLAQYYYSEYSSYKGKAIKDKALKTANIFRGIAIFLALTSYASFLCGLYNGYHGLP